MKDRSNESDDSIEEASQASHQQANKTKLTKEELNEKNTAEVLSRVMTGNLISTRDRVAYVLNQYPQARNSDIELAWTYWELFERSKFNGKLISKEDLYKLTRLPSLSRHRAKIQNEYNLFLADAEVRRHRKGMSEEFRLNAVEDQPYPSAYSVYIDESGKTQEYLSVGSLWLLEGGLKIYHCVEALTQWKKDKGLTSEFHFVKMTPKTVNNYKEFFLKFLDIYTSYSFKFIVLKNSGHQDKEKAITDLTCHLIINGVEHENQSGRAPLPRSLYTLFDENESGSDILKAANIRERVKAQKLDGLYVGSFTPVDSKEDLLIQIVDLFTGAINRKLNPSDSRNQKDDFSDFVFDCLGFNFDTVSKDNSDIDYAAMFDFERKDGVTTISMIG
ncbi:DUF3800 domain-containing protein [Spirosoma luteum]|uniref:DUF3800 domain-containing protein n=1 Tax=Spirosoma luteum TaxID=431553 RepID=UPI00038040F1|nr:DUF3800 domain-containing protein [Spirosoma luteum]